MADKKEEITEIDELVVAEPASQNLEWSGVKANFTDSMFERARAYGSYVNKDRALPDVRDGLKPVQRRIIFAMNQPSSARAHEKYQKSAKTVGKVIGDYHPHGDTAVYDAMVRMAQPFIMNIPLIDGQGNWGSIDGDPAAAQRYTESRLTKIATESSSTTDLHTSIVPHKANFDETKQEAIVLPITFPNLLVNGAKGIGWSMACEIPPHNLGETIDAAIFLADNPDATIKQIMRRIPGPDFPSGGIIVNPEVLLECYTTGRGTVLQQARYTIENVPGNQQAVVITDLPYMTGPEKVIKQIVQAARDGKITEVTELPRDVSDKLGLKVLVKCKRGGNVQKLVADLMRYTDMRKTIAFNMNVLIERTPRVVNLKEALQYFIDFRILVVTNRLEKERRDLHLRLRRNLALMAALDVIDQVVKIIRSSKDDTDSKTKLAKLLKYKPHGEKKLISIDDEQAQWIIDMPLKKLNQLNDKDLRAEAKVWATRIDEITKILKSENGVKEIIKEELREAKKKYAEPRKTAFGGDVAIEAAGTGRSDAAVVSGPVEPVRVYVSESGMAIATPRSSKIPSAAPLKSGDARLVSVFDAKTDQAVYAFTEQGICYRTNISDLGVEKSGKGRALVGLTRGDKVVSVSPIGTATNYVAVTEQGELKRIEESVIAASHAGGLPYIKVEGSDRVIAVLEVEEKDEIILSTSHGQALRTPVSKMRAVKGGNAGGYVGMTFVGDDFVTSACVARGDYLLVVHETGQAKKVPLKDYPSKGRGGKGVASAAIDKPTRGPGPAGNVVAALALSKKSGTLIFTQSGQLLQDPLSKVGEGTRAAVSKPSFDLGPGDNIIGIAYLEG
jgi:DNA gyrase subunit A